MSTDVICGIIMVIGTIVSAAISAATSKKVATNEIRKLKLTWNREDAITSAEDIAELTRLVYDFVTCQNDFFAIPAISKAAEMRAKATGDFSNALDKLYAALSQCDRQMSKQELSEVIKQNALGKDNPTKDQRKHHKNKDT